MNLSVTDLFKRDPNLIGRCSHPLMLNREPAAAGEGRQSKNEEKGDCACCLHNQYLSRVNVEKTIGINVIITNRIIADVANKAHLLCSPGII